MERILEKLNLGASVITLIGFLYTFYRFLHKPNHPFFIGFTIFFFFVNSWLIADIIDKANKL